MEWCQFCVWSSLVNSSVDLHFVSRWYLSLGVGQWHGGWVSGLGSEPSVLRRPPWPAFCWHLLKEQALLSRYFIYQDVQATTQPAAKRNRFISDKGERKYILKKVFLWPFCFDFFILLAFISFKLHPQWSLKSNQLFGISLVMKKKYWGSLISTVLASFEEWFPYLLLHLSQFSFWKDCVLNTSCVCSPLMPQITRFETQTLGLWTVRIWMSCLTTARCNFLSGKMVIMYEKFVVRPRWGNERAGYITRSSRKVFITRCQRGT